VFAFATGNRGAAVVEFAVLTPVLLLILLGILDFGRAMNYKNDATHLASEGARFAIVNRKPPLYVNGIPQPCPTSDLFQDCLTSQGDTAELRDTDDLQVCIDFPGTSTQVGQPVKVTVRFRFTWLNFIGNALGTGGSNFQSSSTMRLEQTPSNYASGCST
jgi:TadE-like protein